MCRLRPRRAQECLSAPESGRNFDIEGPWVKEVGAAGVQLCELALRHGLRSARIRGAFGVFHWQYGVAASRGVGVPRSQCAFCGPAGHRSLGVPRSQVGISTLRGRGWRRSGAAGVHLCDLALRHGLRNEVVQAW